MVRRTVPLTTLLAGCALLACTGGPSGSDAPLVPGRVAGSSSGNSTAPGAAAGSTGGSAPGGPGPTSAPGGAGAPGGPAAYPPPLSAAEAACVDRTIAGLSAPQRLGQLFMVGLQPGQAPGGLDSAIATHRVGAVIYLGGWSGGAAKVADVSAHMQALATGPVDLLIAADQEGGAVQQLKGPGFTLQPRAVEQGRETPAALTARATIIGRELRAAGVNVDLAPVADTVPTAMTTRNQPIGRWGRQYAADPQTVAAAVPAVVAGLQTQRVIASVKHFPGLGRVTGNTDTTAVGITDETATRADPHLEPFRAGMAAGVGMVMVSSARYPRLDATNQAVFSRAIVTDLLRTQLGWQGVVITDDVGSAKAVAAVPVGDRAVRFLAAGGDIVLTAQAGQLPTMLTAVRTRAAADPDFAAALDAATRRVIGLKVRFGLVRCG